MNHEREPGRAADAERDGLRRQGRAVLCALGERGLAREFDRRADSAPDRDALAELLLDCLRRRKAR